MPDQAHQSNLLRSSPPRRVEPVRSEGSTGTSPSARLSDYGTAGGDKRFDPYVGDIWGEADNEVGADCAGELLERFDGQSDYTSSVRAIAACVVAIRSACARRRFPESTHFPAADGQSASRRPSTTRPDTTWTDISVIRRADSISPARERSTYSLLKGPKSGAECQI